MSSPSDKSVSLPDLLTEAQLLARELRTSRPASADAIANIQGDLRSLLRCADLVLALDRFATNEAESHSVNGMGPLSLNIGRLIAQGLLDSGSGRLATKSRKQSLPIRIERNPDQSLVLILGPAKLPQRVRITTTTPKFGGTRYWMHCPGLPGESCDRRAMLLFQPSIFARLACRTCYSHLPEVARHTAEDVEYLDFEATHHSASTARSLRRPA